MSRAQALREALDDVEEQAWQCRTCTAPFDDEHKPYCRHCGMYWQDCANGLWENRDGME
jgi:rubrerythrin